MGLFPETVITFFSSEHHGHPVITGVIHNFLEATLFTFSIKIFSPVASVNGRRTPAACDKKHIWSDWRKRRCVFPSAGFLFVSDRTVFPIATIKKRNYHYFFNVKNVVVP